MGKKRSRVKLSEYISQRGTGQAIKREEALVYDFMPVILGEQFRTDNVLSHMLLRPAPEDAPFILKTNAYETLGTRYLEEEEEITPALECYRIALDSRTNFARFMRRIQDAALLTDEEKEQLSASTDFEKALTRRIAETHKNPDQEAYQTWVETLRTAQKKWKELNRNNYGSRAYIEACLSIGEYREAAANAKKQEDKQLIQRVKEAQPKEILNLTFLKRYIEENFPESTIAGR